MDRDENALRVIVQVSDREYHLDPSPETVNTLKAVRNKLQQLMDTEIEVEGEVLEVWEKQTVQHPAYETEEYVRIP